MDEGSHSVVKNELETRHTEDNTQVKINPSADVLSINVEPYAFTLESGPASAKKSPVNPQEPGPFPTTEEPNRSQLKNETIALRSDLKKSQDLEEKMNCNISQLGNELTTVKYGYEDSVSSLKTINTSLAAKLEKVDPPPMAQNNSFPPKD